MKTSVFLVNFGAPATLDDVPLFLRNLTGRDAPPPAVEGLKARYRAIGGGSPLAAITEAQAAALSEATGLPVACAFRYSSPTLEEAINGCYKSAVERIVFFVMSPFYTSRTVGAYRNAVEAYLPLLPYRPEVVFVDSWHDAPLFRKAWAARVREASVKKDAFYLFSAHSLPVSCKDEPYRAQVEETAAAVAALAGISDWAMGWQSAPPTGEPWMEPTVEAVMDGVADKTKAVCEVPIGFVSDHLETLYDIDIVHAGYARSKGLDFSRVPSLNTYPPFIDALKSVLYARLGAAA